MSQPDPVAMWAPSQLSSAGTLENITAVFKFTRREFAEAAVKHGRIRLSHVRRSAMLTASRPVGRTLAS